MAEIDRFVKCKIIETVNNSDYDQFISNIFIRPKSDGRIRIVLNLKEFNRLFVDKIHFKMETLSSVINAMRKDCYFESVDIADAFYSIPIHREYRN